MPAPRSILAFNDPWHDSSFCMFGEREVVHVESERFTRRKYEQANPLLVFCDLYPEKVAEFSTIAIEEGGSSVSAIVQGVIGRRGEALPKDLTPWLARLRDKDSQFAGGTAALSPAFLAFLRHLHRPDVEVHFCGHHAAHAANAFFSSGAEESLVITLDGIGTDFVPGSPTSFLAGRDERPPSYAVHGSVSHAEGQRCEPAFHLRDMSFGFAWARVTEHVLGFNEGEEGSAMAMAALGDPARFRAQFESDVAWLPTPDHSLVAGEREAMTKFVADLKGAIRQEQDRFDIAAALQACTERRFHAFLQRFVQPHHRHLSLCGGAILNCQMIGKIFDWFPHVRDVYVPPAPYDGGISIGAAQMIHHGVHGGTSPWAGHTAPFALGKRYSRTEVVGACRSAGVRVEPADAARVHAMLAEGKVVALFQDAAESGRRALGHRSILADPRNPKMKAWLNETIKHRQWFRPFAPMVLAEKAGEWFDGPAEFASPYMSFAVPVREDRRERIPAVVHLDGSARVQTVHADLTPGLHSFLAGWEAVSGIPVLLNTSFNDREPIVESPSDALNTLKRSQVDAVYFPDHGLLAMRESRIET
jgi:carbamoyltransferase